MNILGFRIIRQSKLDQIIREVSRKQFDAGVLQGRALEISREVQVGFLGGCVTFKEEHDRIAERLKIWQSQQTQDKGF